MTALAIIVAIVVVAIVVAWVAALCVAAGDADDAIERMSRDRERKQDTE